MTKQATGGTAAHLDFYLDRGCVVVPCLPGTKKIRKGAGEWTPDHSKTRRDELTRNAAVRNGTGGVLVVDVDAKNGGSLELMAKRFPGSTVTRTIQTVSPGEDGRLGAQLIYALPEAFKIRSSVLVRNDAGQPMIEVAAFAMVPGSRARGSDGVMRTYEVVHDLAASPPPEELLAAVEGRTAVEADTLWAEEIAPSQARAMLDKLTGFIASAGYGQRNEVFTRYALVAVRLCTMLGEDAQDVLTTAYEVSGGSDSSWVKSAVRSAVRLAGNDAGGWAVLGPMASARLIGMRNKGRLAAWPGKPGASDRRVFLALIGACIDQYRDETTMSTRKLAVRAGVTRETVEASLKRLEAAGRVESRKLGDSVVRRPVLLPDDPIHILSPLLVSGNPPTGSISQIDPLHVVWSSPMTPEGHGLDGRHGQLFDLVCAGLTTARALADHTGSRSDSVSRTLVRLVEVGLLVKSGADYAPAEDASTLMNRLALELGAAEVCARREDQYRDELQGWDEYRQRRQIQHRWDSETGEQWWELPDGTRIEVQAQATESAGAWVELSNGERVEIEREWAEAECHRCLEEQLLLQHLGLPNELG